MPEEAPRVFISYSHDSQAHRDKVLAFADRLRRETGSRRGSISTYNCRQRAGMRIALGKSASRLRADRLYGNRIGGAWNGEEEPGVGNGVRSEANLIRNYFYEDGSATRKFVPVLFADGSPTRISPAN